MLAVFTKNNLAQIGGDNVYEFLNMPASARVAALGDNFLASKDNDITLTLTNPSLITRNMDNHLSLSFPISITALLCIPKLLTMLEAL